MDSISSPLSLYPGRASDTRLKLAAGEACPGSGGGGSGALNWKAFGYEWDQKEELGQKGTLKANDQACAIVEPISPRRFGAVTVNGSEGTDLFWLRELFIKVLHFHTPQRPTEERILHLKETPPQKGADCNAANILPNCHRDLIQVRELFTKVLHSQTPWLAIDERLLSLKGHPRTHPNGHRELSDLRELFTKLPTQQTHSLERSPRSDPVMRTLHGEYEEGHKKLESELEAVKTKVKKSAGGNQHYIMTQHHGIVSRTAGLEKKQKQAIDERILRLKEGPPRNRQRG
ncbi:uncharacterized protein MYCFIDRAFT_180062 [Pseudocercospora fijiensis CIRAD86]|uniref:Uncharacterized protein n=1 Tax=Pseudocercospora fijiensis (strain CIRAD86) TaxID=383855 RepID=M2YH81_PSEFD|nr:uncharacterized protein MYCFIDRAFT_180062 [Pseudocercospora fijiensis CIRAD86]EME77185.1 hypothetical protein MYCFIDRAFT_180062 [Pseudocercospora fijiensis CIRAD86]